MAHEIPRDEHGYVNNRGRSKYWGVTVAQDGIGKDYWIVSYNAVDKNNKTHTLHSKTFVLNEKDAARIAAMIYETGGRWSVPTDYVLSHDKRHVLYVRGNVIYREFYTSHKLYKGKPNLSLFDSNEPAVVKPDVQVIAPTIAKERKQSQPKPIAKVLDSIPASVREKVETDNEAVYVSKMTQMILEAKLSERSTKALIAVLDSTLY